MVMQIGRKFSTVGIRVILVVALVVSGQLPLKRTTAALADGNAGSSKVAMVEGAGGLFSQGYSLPSSFTGITFTKIRLSDISAAGLRPFDTLVLSQQCDIGRALGASQKTDLLEWVKNGGKLIIYDSDLCGGTSVDYSWLPYPFSTNNPGAQGSSNGTFEIVANDSMISSDTKSASYIDVNDINSNSDIGDANVMVTKDANWCGDAVARNLNNKAGFVHAYAFHGKGLIIYNGLDLDHISGNRAMQKLWENELRQPWDPAGGSRPAGLACRLLVVTGAPPKLDLWPWIIILPLLLLLGLLLWLLSRLRRRSEPEAITSIAPPEPPGPEIKIREPDGKELLEQEEGREIRAEEKERPGTGKFPKRGEGDTGFPR